MLNLQQIVILILFYISLDKIVPLFNKESKLTNNNDKLLNDNISKQNQMQLELEFNNKLKDRDYRVGYDVFAPGERRLPRHQYPRGAFKDSTNIPTRGLPDNYQYMGNLIRQGDEKILPLFGRQEYPGSDYYEYYVVVNQDGNFGAKLPLYDKPVRELEDDTTVSIDFFDPSKGDFVYKQFDYDVPRYNPYDF